MGTRKIPLFPLTLVLFPGMTLPLHIFEPRYKRMIKDVASPCWNFFSPTIPWIARYVYSPEFQSPTSCVGAD